MRRAHAARLSAALDAAEGAASDRPPAFAGAVRALLQSGRAFGDLAVQIHAGQAVSAEHVSWHIDSANSTVHLALSFGGERALHSRRFASADADGAGGGGDDAHRVEWQRAGDVYLSSPASFEHGVEYPRAYRWRNRAIAVQARFLLEVKRRQRRLLVERARAGGRRGSPSRCHVSLSLISLLPIPYRSDYRSER